MADEKLHPQHHDESPPSYAEANDVPSHSVNNQATTDEKLALERRDQAQLAPPPPYSGPSTAPLQALKFTLILHKPTLDNWTLTITPTEPLAHVCYWQLNYPTKYNAVLNRHAPPPQQKQIVREMARIVFPKVKWPGCGPTITFEPHEAEYKRKGLRHISPTDRFMECSGWFSTTFALDLPAAGNRVAWKVANEEDIVQALKLEASQRTEKSRTMMSEKQSFQEASTENSEGTWTPFPTQSLIEETSGRILATYSRSAPWSKSTGLLTIPQHVKPCTAEFIEGVVIACAAMVGMQDQIGLFSSIIESGYDNITAGKGKGRAMG